MRKAPTAGADTLVFDLEDAVAPEQKATARTAVADVLSDPSFDPDAEVCVRVNPGVTAEDDLDQLCARDADFDGVMIPKTERAADVERVATHLADAGVTCPILALVENAAGVLAAHDIATAPATDALVFGAEDLAADLGATRTADGTEVLHAREHVVLAASAADVDAIDTVYTDFEDDDGLREETTFAITLGYDGKLAIHPAQVPVINDAFTPDPERVKWAQRVLDARAAAAEDGRGVFRVDGEMIDAPLVRQAERIVERARAAGTLQESG